MQLIHQKGFYPFFYLDSHAKFQEKSLRRLEKWTNCLQYGQVSITPQNFQIATKVFGCESFGSYHDLYLTTDTLLLASVIEQFRKVSYSTYGLHSVHYYTSSHFSGDADMKASKASVELLTAGSHLEMAENLIRGFISSVFSKHLATITNTWKDLTRGKREYIAPRGCKQPL